MFIRNCPQCSKVLEYKSKDAFNLANKKRTLCRSCTTSNQYKKEPTKNKGKNNGRFGKNLLEILTNKYGIEEAQLRYNNWCTELSKNGFKEGSLNPSFGKQPPLNAGKSYKGWYKNLFFRSTLELMFLFDFENNHKTLPLTADVKDLRVDFCYNNKKHTYIADFYDPQTNTVFEMKCKNFLNADINVEKFKAAKSYFSSKNIRYVIITENQINNFIGFDAYLPFLKRLSNDNLIKLTDSSLLKLNKRLKIKNENQKIN